MRTSVDLRFIQDVSDIMENGFLDINPRPKYEDGSPAHTFSVNHVVRQYDLSNGEFPILTLRPIGWRGAIKEILWIYQDQSNSLDVLRNKYGLKIWDEWESKSMPGTIGVRYGETVRRHRLIDKLIEGIKKDPYGRRHKVNLWQESDFATSDGLMPCCYETQWNVRGEYLDMLLNQRSGDMITASGAGCWNEVQYAALLMMIARATGYRPGKFTHVVANEQIYLRHMDAAKELIERYDHANPVRKDSVVSGEDAVRMTFNPKSDNFYNFTIDNFELVGYDPQKPQIKLELGI